MSDRYVLLGLAPPRTGWFSRVAGWAASARLPAEFVRCVSLAEVNTRLQSARTHSALLIDAGMDGLDRDLFAVAGERGCAVVVIDGPDQPRRDWRRLGAAGILAPTFAQDELTELLGDVALRVPTATSPGVDLPPPRPSGEQGRLIAMTGPGGCGTSVSAIALAQGLSATEGRLPRADGRPGPRRRPSVLLADLCRNADQALYHDATDRAPGLPELVEAHRTGRPSTPEVLAQTFHVPDRGYRLLLGMRRPRNWVGLRTHAVAAALDSLQWLADVVIADLEPEVEGEPETGSLDVQDRHLLARSVVPRADLVLVVGTPTLHGIAGIVRTSVELLEVGVAPERLVPVANRSSRSPRRRGEVTATVSELLAAATGIRRGRFRPVLHVPERDPEPALRDGVALPTTVPRVLTEATLALLDRAAVPPPRALTEPTPISPGSLSTYGSPQP